MTSPYNIQSHELYGFNSKPEAEPNKIELVKPIYPMYIYILYMYVCMYVYVYACMYVCMYVCMHVCMYVSLYIYIYIYIYICTISFN